MFLTDPNVALFPLRKMRKKPSYRFIQDRKSYCLKGVIALTLILIILASHRIVDKKPFFLFFFS